MRATATLACAGLVLLAACSSGRRPVITAKIVDAIKTDEVHWNADWRSGDPARIADHYAPGAIVMSPGVAPLTDPKGIRAAIAGLTDEAGHTLVFASDQVDVAASGDVAVSHGAYTETGPDPTTHAMVTTHGSYVTVYRPQGGGVWKAVWDIQTPGPPG